MKNCGFKPANGSRKKDNCSAVPWISTRVGAAILKASGSKPPTVSS